jgi:CRISPR/Cas system CSM-associated protein Csm2 small subunit
MTRKKILGLLLGGLMLGTWAQAGPLQGGGQARARLRENINTLRLLRMTEVLELTEDQTAKLFPALTRIEKEKAEFQRLLGAEILRLRVAIAKSTASDDEILGLVGRVREIGRSIKEKDEEFDAVLDRSLTPVQKGKYVIFQIDFARGLREKLDRARQIRGKN